MTLKLVDLLIKGYKRVVHVTNEVTKLNCIISIHSTKLGPALGGVRSWDYDSFEEQKADALKLSEAMTLKNSVCGINFGGGKAVLNLKGINKSPELYQSYAEAVDTLKGDYLTAGDVNTFKEDLIECSKVTKHVYGINVETSAPTSKGIFHAIKTTHNFINTCVVLLSVTTSCKSCSGIIFRNSKKLFNTGQYSCSVLKNNNVEEASAPNKLFNTIM